MIKLLDHGHIRLVEAWGADERIIEAARQSTGKGFLGWGPACGRCGKQWPPGAISCGDGCQGGASETKSGDEKLLKYLYENAHSTPFEFSGAIIEVQAPIFVFREWHRHRTASYAEMSSRYTPLPDFNYVPTVERLMVNSKTNKQAGTIKGAEELTEVQAEQFRKTLVGMYQDQESLYQWALKTGVPKELARVHLPVGRYSRMWAQANLRNWLGFMTLRSAPGAQYEIRVYSQALHGILKEVFPKTMELFEKGTT